MAIINNRFQPAQNFVRNESVKGKKEIDEVKLNKPGKTEEEQPNYQKRDDMIDLVTNGGEGDYITASNSDGTYNLYFKGHDENGKEVIKKQSITRESFDFLNTHTDTSVRDKLYGYDQV